MLFREEGAPQRRCFYPTSASDVTVRVEVRNMINGLGLKHLMACGGRREVYMRAVGDRRRHFGWHETRADSNREVG